MPGFDHAGEGASKARTDTAPTSSTSTPPANAHPLFAVVIPPGLSQAPQGRAAQPRLFRSLAPLDEGFEAVIVVGQGLGEGEELGDGVVRAGETHLDPVAADRDAGGQAGEPAVEGVGGDRNADPGAAGLAERGPHPVAPGGFVPEGGVRLEPPELAEQRGAGEGADGAGPLGPEGPHQSGRPGARDAEERFEVAAGEEGPVERVELLDGVGEGEEPPGAGRHVTDLSTR